ncbi:hypothetical protein BH10PAT1_BH10PAT1_7320 [soil metagenome]
MAKILLVAENYAFGPIGKLLTIADVLRRRGHKLIFAGFGTSLQMARDYPFDRIYQVDTENEKYTDKLSKIMKDVDLLVSSMDIQSVVVAKSLKKPVVYIDCLFWFWEDIQTVLFDIDIYIRERSINDTKADQNAKKFGPKIKNLYTVGPIIPLIKTRRRKKQVVISYGGGEATHWYKVGRDTNYPFVMTNILLKYVDWTPFSRIIIATGKHILDDLSKEFVNSPFKFTNCGSHEGFLKEMSKSEILLTTAGLVTTQEAFYSNTPVIFLPPSNDSHYILLDELRDQIPNIPSVHLSDFMDKLILRGKSVEDNISNVMKQLHKVEKSESIQAGIGSNINKLLSARATWLKTSVGNNKLFLDNLGENGAETVVEKIEELFRKQAE